MSLQMESDFPLRNLLILVAEDEFLIAAAVEDTLRDAGADVIRASTVNEALLDAAGEALSVALLDVRLGHQTTEPIADALFLRDIPFLFYSGHGLPDDMRAKHPHAGVLIKPVTSREIVDALWKLTRN